MATPLLNNQLFTGLYWLNPQTKKNPKGLALGSFKQEFLTLESSRVAFGYHNLQLLQYWHKQTKVINSPSVSKLLSCLIVAILLVIAKRLNHPDQPKAAGLAIGARGEAFIGFVCNKQEFTIRKIFNGLPRQQPT